LDAPDNLLDLIYRQEKASDAGWVENLPVLTAEGVAAQLIDKGYEYDM
jgi:hypothetical protein